MTTVRPELDLSQMKLENQENIRPNPESATKLRVEPGRRDADRFASGARHAGVAGNVPYHQAPANL